ncbi:MAG: hypothetical protein U0610_33250 [bacterium]
MSERERRREHSGTGGPPSGADDGAGALDAARAAGDRLLAAGQDIVRRVLSGNSEQFLAASRQEGGQ